MAVEAGETVAGWLGGACFMVKLVRRHVVREGRGQGAGAGSGRCGRRGGGRQRWVRHGARKEEDDSCMPPRNARPIAPYLPLKIKGLSFEGCRSFHPHNE